MYLSWIMSCAFHCGQGNNKNFVLKIFSDRFNRPVRYKDVIIGKNDVTITLNCKFDMHFISYEHEERYTLNQLSHHRDGEFVSLIPTVSEAHRFFFAYDKIPFLPEIISCKYAKNDV